MTSAWAARRAGGPAALSQSHGVHDSECFESGLFDSDTEVQCDSPAKPECQAPGAAARAAVTVTAPPGPGGGPGAAAALVTVTATAFRQRCSWHENRKEKCRTRFGRYGVTDSPGPTAGREL